MSVNFHIKVNHNILIELKEVDGAVVLYMNDHEIAYFDKDALNLLPDCHYNGEIPKEILDENGYLKIIKA